MAIHPVVMAQVVVGPTGNPDGCDLPVVPDTGDGALMTFWQLNDPQIQTIPTAIATDLGLTPWVNPLAFAPTIEPLPQCRDRWLACGRPELAVRSGAGDGSRSDHPL